VSTENEPEARLEGPAFVLPGALTLLDLFAASALMGMLAFPDAEEDGTRRHMAESAFVFAREMLRARAKHVPLEDEGGARGVGAVKRYGQQ
jgi:hypothetical protein